MACTKALLFCTFLRQWLCVTILNRSLFKFLLFPAISAHPDDFPLGIRANTNFRKNTTKQIKIFTSESFHLDFFLAGSNLSGLGQTLSPVASVFLFPRLYQLVTCSRGLPSRLPLLNTCTPKQEWTAHSSQTLTWITQLLGQGAESDYRSLFNIQHLKVSIMKLSGREWLLYLPLLEPV